MFFFNKKNEKKTTLKTYFFTGIVVTAPIAITLYLAVEFILFIDLNNNDFSEKSLALYQQKLKNS